MEIQAKSLLRNPCATAPSGRGSESALSTYDHLQSRDQRERKCAVFWREVEINFRGGQVVVSEEPVFAAFPAHLSQTEIGRRGDRIPEM